MSADTYQNLSNLKNNLQWKRQYCDTVQTYLDFINYDFERFIEKEMVQDACLSKISQISECITRIRDKYPEIYTRYFAPSLNGVTGLRNFTTHQYERVKMNLVWEFLTTEITRIESTSVRVLDEMYKDLPNESFNNKIKSVFNRKRRL